MRSPRKALFLTLILLATVLQLPLAMGDPEWLSGWTYRVKLTIDSGDVDTVLTDFPVLVYLSASSGINNDNVTFIFDEIGANYLKIAITKDDGITECYAEIEGWDSVNKKGWIWTKIPSISNTSDTDFFLYYDNEHADNTDYVGVTTTIPAENVWDSDYSAVHHMRDKGVNEEMWDSTDNDVDGDKKGINEPNQVEGIIDRAQDFDGVDDSISLQDTPFDYQTAFTFEFWIKTTDTTSDGRIIFKNAGIPNRAYFIRLNTGSFEIYLSVDGTNAQFDMSGSNNYNSGSWVYVAIVYDAGTIYWYKNGAPDGTDATYNSINMNAVVLLLVNPALPVDLDLDEFRGSSIVRTSNYFKVSYETGRDHLIDFGSEEVFLYAPTYLFGAGFNTSSPYVSLYWTSNLIGISLFEVQNSTDKISWDYLGSNTTREYHDLQVVNGTERYYRVRACNFTGSVWVNSTWTDIDFETVYFLSTGAPAPAPAVLAMGKYYAMSIILLILGVLIGIGMRRKR